MNTDKFSWPRFLTLTRRNILENKRGLLMGTGVGLGLILLVFLLISKSFSGDKSATAPRAFAIASASLFIASFAAQIIGSFTFCSLKTKARRISSMMLPAARSEKFLSNVAIYVVGGNIVLVGCLVVADCISALIFGMAPAVTQIPLSIIFHSGETFEMALAMGLGGLWLGLFGQSLYVTGSALWPRYSFAKTFVVLIALQIILPIILPMDFIGTMMHDFIHLFHGMDIKGTAAHILGWSLMALLYAVLAVIYVIAWNIFKRTQIIQRFKMK